MATKKAKKKVVKKVKAKVVVEGQLSLYGYGMHVTSLKDAEGKPDYYHASLNGGVAKLHFALEKLYAKAGITSLGRKVKITFELV